MKKRWKIGIVVGSVALVALLVLGVGLPVLADEAVEGKLGRPLLGLGFHPGSWSMFDKVAEILGLSPEGLFGELHGGKTIETLAEEKGVELDAIQAATEAARKAEMTARIEQGVEEGTLTQAQADWMLEGQEQGWMGGRGMRGPGMRGGFRPTGGMVKGGVSGESL